MYRRALKIKEVRLGPNDTQVASTLIRTGDNTHGWGGRQQEAKDLYRRALDVLEARLWWSDTQVSSVLHALGQLLRAELGRLEKSEQNLRRAFKIRETKAKAQDGVDVRIFAPHKVVACLTETRAG